MNERIDSHEQQVSAVGVRSCNVYVCNGDDKDWGDFIMLPDASYKSLQCIVLVDGDIYASQIGRDSQEMQGRSHKLNSAGVFGLQGDNLANNRRHLQNAQNIMSSRPTGVGHHLHAYNHEKNDIHVLLENGQCYVVVMSNGSAVQRLGLVQNPTGCFLQNFICKNCRQVFIKAHNDDMLGDACCLAPPLSTKPHRYLARQLKASILHQLTTKDPHYSQSGLDSQPVSLLRTEDTPSQEPESQTSQHLSKKKRKVK